MDRIYRMTSTLSDGFFTYMSDYEKDKKLKESGVTFLYSKSGNKIAIYYDESVETPESKMFKKINGPVLEESSKEELKNDLNRCYMAIGVHEKRP